MKVPAPEPDFFNRLCLAARNPSTKFFHAILAVSPAKITEKFNFTKFDVTNFIIIILITELTFFFFFFRFLASGATFRDLGFHFRLGESTISKAVREVCAAIWNNMQPEFMPTPTQEFWRERAEEFKLRLHFPNCLAAIDGKHVIIRKPLKSGSNYFNYKQSFSIVLLAAVDANYKFCIVDIGTKGRFSDGFTFTNCNFGKRLLSNTLDIPKPKPIDNSDEEVPYVFVADAAFPLLENLMRPYPGVKTKSSIPNRIFNYRLSRARQLVECAFGILAARFRIYGRALEIQPRNVELLIKCTTVLHNYLRSYITYEEELESLALEDFVEPAGQLVNLSRTRSRSSNVAFKVREQFRTYFNSEEGSVPWQLDAIKRGKY